ncbi:MAG: NADH-quinone oxidoreductase subunit L [Chloroflexi bacterium]|nr:NADH-quinone oxidoreductase subunit L [Chloroflexota bacterium]
MMFNLALFVILCPLAGLCLNLAGSRWLRAPMAGIIASIAAAASFFFAASQLIALQTQPQGTIVVLGDWLPLLGVQWALQVDALSVTMMLLVTGVGTLIHVYACGYMRGDAGYTRFFVYLNLFLVAMLLLVMADNYVLLFAGWEGVGLCSYLLIGFWFDKANGVGTRNSDAARKAFVVNRIGDVGLLLALLLLYVNLGSLNFDAVFAQAAATLSAGAPLAVVIALLLFVAVTGKSAQIPLFVWLPDAMAGPTPVSALIHAATMVTAGVYLMARSQVFFDLAPLAQNVAVLVGAGTAVLAATIAVGQYDIKRVLAYSTISQLGFMVAAAGLGAYAAALFHLITHAFFKALLFLAAGSVIHGVEHGQSATGLYSAQDMRALGGLRRRMPVTFATFLIGALALAGLPPLAGFFSKDEILAAALAENTLVCALLALTVLLTAFYVGRQTLAVFLGEARSEGAAHAHESPAVMTLPLVGLALLTAFGGFMGIAAWLGGVFGEHTPEANVWLMGGATLLALAGIGLAWRMPLVKGRMPCALQNGWWIDTLYGWLIVRPFQWLGGQLARFDRGGLGWLEQRLAAGVRGASWLMSKTQTGQLNWNGVGIVAALALVLAAAVLGGGA